MLKYFYEIKETYNDSNNLDYYNLNSKSLKTMFTHISSIKDKHIVYGLKDVIDVIIYNYVPELLKLKLNEKKSNQISVEMKRDFNEKAPINI